MSLHVRLDLELGITIETGKRSIARVSTQVNNQLTGGATGVGTRLTFDGLVVAVYSHVFLDTAIVHCSVTAEFTFKWFFPCVAPDM